jgi:hypothetical protein
LDGDSLAVASILVPANAVQTPNAFLMPVAHTPVLIPLTRQTHPSSVKLSQSLSRRSQVSDRVVAW